MVVKIILIKNLKRMKKIFVSIVICLLLVHFADAQVVNNWRGPDRDGIYHETGLLKSWPPDGPPIAWVNEDLGHGYTSPVIANGKVYVTGIEGDYGFIYVLSIEGEIEKRIQYGKEVSARAGYPGTRSSPTIVDNLAYIATGHGTLVCMDLNTDKERWSLDLFSDFDGKNIRWSFTENLIINGDVLYVSPGGREYNIVALNRHNGELIWTNKGEGNLSAYCSPLLINHNGRKILVQMMAENTFGIDAVTGKTLWSHPHENRRKIHPNAPIYYDNNLFVFSGYGKGGERLDLNESGTRITQVWSNETIDNQMGGAVIIDDRIYLSGHNNRSWYCVDWETGKILYELSDIAKGTIIAAEGLLYVYSDRGELALLEPMDDRFRIVGQADVIHGSEQHWAHPVIQDGILYIRHGEALIAYDIRDNN